MNLNSPSTENDFYSPVPDIFTHISPNFSRWKLSTTFSAFTEDFHAKMTEWNWFCGGISIAPQKIVNQCEIAASLWKFIIFIFTGTLKGALRKGNTKNRESKINIRMIRRRCTTQEIVSQKLISKKRSIKQYWRWESHQIAGAWIFAPPLHGL